MPPDRMKELSERLDALGEDHKAEPGDRLSATDARDYFRRVDQAAQDPDVDPAQLEVLGARFAERFIVPYLHEGDAVGIISETAALIEIHRRGTLRMYEFNETSDGAQMVVGFEQTGARGRRTGPSRFDIAIIRGALESRYAHVDIVPIPSRGRVGEQLYILMERSDRATDAMAEQPPGIPAGRSTDPVRE